MQDSPQYPSQVLTCSSTEKVLTTNLDTFTTDNYTSIAGEVFAQMDTKTDKGAYAACILRLAGHDLMDFRLGNGDATSGGSDGCINFSDDDNIGLAECLVSTGV